MELIQAGKNTYYIKNATNIGIYRVNEKDVYLIDTGNDKDCGKKILKILEEQKWNLKGIINTHSHADHIGGNSVLQDRTGCNIFNNKIENCFTENPILESTVLYGAYPFKELRNKFLFAKESNTERINCFNVCDNKNNSSDNRNNSSNNRNDNGNDECNNKDCNFQEGLECLNLNGHSYDMIGVKTSDDVYFLGDALVSKSTIEKYHIFFIENVKEFLNTLGYLENLSNLNELNSDKNPLYVPSHAEASRNILDLIKINRNTVYEIINKIIDICEIEKSFEVILKNIFDEYEMKMNLNQYFLVGSTIKAYLSYLVDEGKLCYEFKENNMLWKKI